MFKTRCRACKYLNATPFSTKKMIAIFATKGATWRCFIHTFLKNTTRNIIVKSTMIIPEIPNASFEIHVVSVAFNASQVISIFRKVAHDLT